MMRYKDLIGKIPSDLDVEFEVRGGHVFLHIKRLPKVAANPLKIIPSIF